MIKNLIKNPIVRKIITLTAIGITLYFVWRQYKKYTNRITNLENALQIMKQQVKIKKREIELIHIANRKKYEMMQNIGENTHTNITENIQQIVTNNYDNYSHERIFKELPMIFKNYNNIEPVHENTNNVNIDDVNIDDIDTDSEDIEYTPNLEVKDDLLEDDINLEPDLDFSDDYSIDNDDNNVNNENIVDDFKKTIQKVQDDIIKEEQENNKNVSIPKVTKFFDQHRPNQLKSKKSRKGRMTSYSVFLKDTDVEKELLKKYPESDFGQLSKLKGKIWRNLPITEKNKYKEQAKIITQQNTLAN